MPARHSSPRFVGRERELTTIASALERAAAGRTTSMLLTGAAGLGVTRLLDEVERRLADLPEPFLVVRCSLDAASPGEPYGPIVAGIGPVLAELDDAELARVIGPVGEPAARLLPTLEPRFAAAGLLPERPWIVDPERRQARLLEALLGCLERLSERSPVLLVVEDLHAADFGTRAFATFLSRITRPARLAMIASYQPDEVTRDHPLRSDLAAMAEANEAPSILALDPLGRDELAALIEGIEERRPSASELLLVSERSRGNPLVAEEIVAARRELTGVSLAGPFEQIVIARLAQRSAGCRRVLRLLALAGGPLTRDELRAATAAGQNAATRGPSPSSTTSPARTPRGRRALGMASFDLDASLAEGAEHGYLRLKATDADGFVQLRHELIARAIASDLLPGQRRREHAALAAALATRPASAARHWLAIHRTEEARAAALAAADQAEAVDAPGDALAALEIALQIGDPRAAEDPSAARASHVALLERAAEAAFSVGRPRRAVAYIEAALGHLGPGDRLEAGRLNVRLGLYRRVDGDHAGGLEAQREAVRLTPATPSVDRARALASLSQALMLDGAFSEAKARAEEAVAMAESLGDDGLPIVCHATCTLGICEAYGGDPGGAISVLQLARDMARSLSRMDDLLRAQANLTYSLELQWRQSEAISVALEAVDESRQAGLEAVYGNQLRGNVASALALTGRWDEAREAARRALEWSPAGPPSIDPAMSLAYVEVESRADEVAAAILGRLLLEVELLPDPQYLIPASRVAAAFAVWRGDYHDALRAVRRGWELARRNEDWIAAARMAATAVDVLASIGVDARERRDLATLAEVRANASEILIAAEDAVARLGSGPTSGSRIGADAWLLAARAHLDRLNAASLPGTWKRLADSWASVGDPYQEARALWRQAEAALSTSEARTGRSAAADPLRRAVAIAVRLQARPLLKELRHLAARGMIKVPALEEAAITTNGSEPVEPTSAPRNIVVAFAPSGSSEGTAFGLSPREREVLRLLAQGKTNREIGDRLFISQKTVGVHVGNILTKLGATGRVEAATVALRLGLTDDEGRS